MQTYRSLVVWLALLLAFVRITACETLTVEPQLVGTRYCLEGTGLTTLRIDLRLKYYNTGSRPVILFRYTPLSGFTLRLRRETDASSPELHEAYSFRRMLDTSKLDSSNPDGQLFTVVKPGSAYEVAVEELRIVLKDAAGGVSFLGKDVSLRVEANTWPDLRDQGEILRSTWKEVGLLSLDRVESSPANLLIEETPRVIRCRDSGVF